MTPEKRAFARAYPFALSDRSFVVSGGVSRAWDDGLSLDGRTAVLAVGSNQSPEQIARKFPDVEHGDVPVMRVRLEGFDSVYSAHISQYASVPATLARSVGTAVTLCVTWLTDAQLARMHETELPAENYRFARLDGVSCAADTGVQLDTVHAYVSTRGHLMENGTPIPLAEVPAEGRRWAAKRQPEMQDWLAGHLAPDGTTDDFIDRHVAEREARVATMRAMARFAAPFAYDRMTVLVG